MFIIPKSYLSGHYCFAQVFSISSGGTEKGTTCSVSDNAPTSNQLLELYGSGSLCITHGRQWMVDSQPTTNGYGGGCYQVHVVRMNDEATAGIDYIKRMTSNEISTWTHSCLSKAFSREWFRCLILLFLCSCFTGILQWRWSIYYHRQ